jgi:eukaryotic-like serine/threonine-protein kinase
VKSVRTATNASWLAPGCSLDRYHLLLQVAEGGMGSLWLARQQGKHGFDRIVAIKTILPKLASDGAFRRMFLDEARVVSRIEHPHVAQVLDLGEERGVLFLVMEWIDGESLNTIGQAFAGDTDEPLPTDILARIMVDACAGLHAAHEIAGDDGLPLGVVHRDVSPHNLLVGFRGTTKIIDFGIAKARDRIGQDTSVGFVKGKVAYMSPEQALGAPVDRRSDVWSAGATMYRFLKGSVPYDAPDPVATLRRLTAGKPPSPLPDHVPKPVRLVVERALALDPAKRFASARDMAAALESAMLTADLCATHEDVAAFMADNLGEGRATRSQQIECAVRESRARMRAEQASTEAAPVPQGPIGPADTMDTSREAARSASSRVSRRPTAIAPVSRRLGDLHDAETPAEEDMAPAPPPAGMPERRSEVSATVLLRVKRQASRPVVRRIAAAGVLAASLVVGFAWHASERSPALAAITVDTAAANPVQRAVVVPPSPALAPSAIPLPPIPATAVLAPVPAEEPPSSDPPVLAPAVAHPRETRVPASALAEPNLSGSADELLERGRAARKAGRIDDAATLFAAAVQKAPADSEALTGLAEVDASRGSMGPAIAAYRRALAANPRYLPAHLGLADSLWASGQRDEGRTSYRSLIAQFPASLCPDRARERSAVP